MKTNRLQSILVLLALCSTFTPTLRAENKTATPRRLPGELPIQEVTAKVAANGDTVAMGTSRIMPSARPAQLRAP